MATVGQRLAGLRKSKGLSQEALCEQIKIKRPTYARYEIDDTQADYDTLCLLADFHNVTTDYILGRSEKQRLTELEDRLVSLTAFKESRDKIAAGLVLDIPKERIPFIVDKLDSEIAKIEEILNTQK